MAQMVSRSRGMSLPIRDRGLVRVLRQIIDRRMMFRFGRRVYTFRIEIHAQEAKEDRRLPTRAASSGARQLIHQSALGVLPQGDERYPTVRVASRRANFRNATLKDTKV